MNNDMQRAIKTAATLRYGMSGPIAAMDMAWQQRHSIAENRSKSRLFVFTSGAVFMYAAVFCIRRFSDDRCMER